MRRSGILLHISSLPGPCGIGTLGREAFRFVDFLARAGQTYWQVLPLGPTGFGDSPYQSSSAFAGNPYFIDLPLLAELGLLVPEDYESLDWGDSPEKVDFSLLARQKEPVLRAAYARFSAAPPPDYEAFCRENADWLEDYALFIALKNAHAGAPWYEWEPPFRLRDPISLAAAREKYASELDFVRTQQYLFGRQWTALRRYADSRGVRIIGDIPIYVPLDSADVWSEPGQFELDGEGRPSEVAGCPPDAFTANGQLWGNPLYRWDAMAADGYQWWIRRFRRCGALCPCIRIDHFRGFDSYYAIPGGAANAREGRWRQGPGMALFRAVREALGEQSIIAENLGFLTPSVQRLLEESGYPGMKVLQFAFDPKGESDYLPHRYEHHCVAYTGTHDNDTILGWFASAPPEETRFAREYLRLTEEEGLHWGMMKEILQSPADTAILTMQDLLGLGGEARMNTPSTLGENWKWRMHPGADCVALADELRYYTGIYRRLP